MRCVPRAFPVAREPQGRENLTVAARLAAAAQYLRSKLDSSGQAMGLAKMIWMAYLNISSVYRIANNLIRVFKAPAPLHPQPRLNFRFAPDNLKPRPSPVTAPPRTAALRVLG